MAARAGGAGSVTTGSTISSRRACGAEPLEAALLTEADRLVGGEDAFLVVDDTALPKKGRHSVGVAPQYASALGRNATARRWCRSRSRGPKCR